MKEPQKKKLRKVLNDVRRTRSKRIAILTEAQEANLRSGQMSAVAKSKLYKHLDTVFPALLEEMELVRSKPILDVWREKNRGHNAFRDLTVIFQELSKPQYGRRVYLDKIKEGRRADDTKEYWVEKYTVSIANRLVAGRKYYTEKIFDKGHMFTGTSIRNDDKKIRLLMEAYDASILSENKRLSVDEIKSILKERQVRIPSSELKKARGDQKKLAELYEKYAKKTKTIPELLEKYAPKS